MKCPFCGSEVTDNFCEDCGAPRPQNSDMPTAPAEAFWNPPPPSGGESWNPPPTEEDVGNSFQQFSNSAGTTGDQPPSPPEAARVTAGTAKDPTGWIVIFQPEITAWHLMGATTRIMKFWTAADPMRKSLCGWRKAST